MMSKLQPSKGVLQEEYQLLVLVAEAMVKKLKQAEDIEASQRFLNKSAEFAESTNVEVNLHGVHFMRKLVKILKSTLANQAAVLPIQEETEIWLEPNIVYMASKKLADGSTIIYNANAKEPTNQWDNGLEKLL